MALYVDIMKKLGDFSLKVKFSTDGGTTALFGLSGSGKSMTLKCIAGIVKPDSGKIVINDRVVFDSENKINLPPQKRNVGYLPQNYALFPNMSVRDNICCGLNKYKRGSRKSLADKYIERFGLQGISSLYPHQISGGQQQRVALARALATEPELLLLDEPFSALDSQLKFQLEFDMINTLSDYDGDVLFVSHNKDEVCMLCDKVCVIDKGTNFNVKTIAEVLDKPENTTEAMLSNIENITPIMKGDNSLLTEFGFAVGNKNAVTNANYLGIKSKDVVLNPQQSDISFEAVITNVIRDSSQLLFVLQIDSNSKPLLASLPDSEDYSINDKIIVGINHSDILYLK